MKDLSKREMNMLKMKLYEELEKTTNNRQLEDLPGEIWVTALGFDGLYEVSSLGRVKSLSREIETKWGGFYNSKEMILKQAVKISKNGRVDGLLISLQRKSFSSQKLIYKSFFPEDDFSGYECVVHLNKNSLDNRIENLKKYNRKESKLIDLEKSERTIKALEMNLKSMANHNKEKYENRTHKECSKCGKIDLVENFPKTASRCQDCINKYVVNRRKNYTYNNEDKKCNRCGLVKKCRDFLKLDNTCKSCRKKLHDIYVNKQKEELGDWYVKQYGKTNYGYKDFTQEIIDKLRAEIQEKRKPKYFIDDKEFLTKADFARYVSKTYKISEHAVLKRLENGQTEYECTLSTKELKRHNLKKRNN